MNIRNFFFKNYLAETDCSKNTLLQTEAQRETEYNSLALGFGLKANYLWDKKRKRSVGQLYNQAS